jgi:3-oxoacyl-[acyl-carrier-protein] synthase I
MTPLGIRHYTLTTALGAGRASQLDALRNGSTGLRAEPFESAALPGWIGVVAGLDTPLPAEYSAWDCRNNRLAEKGLAQDGFAEAVAVARGRYGAARIGVFVGTSTSGVLQTEQAYRARSGTPEQLPTWFQHAHTQNAYSVCDYVQRRLGLTGISNAVSTACSSSAKVFASAQRAIAAGFCDAAVVGGVDSLCLTTLYGFNALQLLAADICRPADANRQGLSIGEAAGFALLEPAAEHALRLEGYGESNDAHHMSAPDPEGRGALAAMRLALAGAGAQPADVDYINLHGTATPANDLAEDHAVFALFGAAVPCSSTKGWTGHTLGAAGMVEAGLALTALEAGLIPQSLNTRHIDPEFRSQIVRTTQQRPIKRVLSNSFGFGGSNCSLLFSRP